MIQLYLAWLGLLGIRRDDVTFRVSIHETADAAAAVEFWAHHVGVDTAEFRRTTLKRHKPVTNRQNVGDDYHGCLTVRVRRSSDLNLLIAAGAKGSPTSPVP